MICTLALNPLTLVGLNDTVTVQLAPAKRSASAQRKAASKWLDDEQPVHSFATLMAEMATLVRNTCRTPSAGSDAPTFEVLTTATAHQQRALALIQAI